METIQNSELEDTEIVLINLHQHDYNSQFFQENDFLRVIKEYFSSVSVVNITSVEALSFRRKLCVALFLDSSGREEDVKLIRKYFQTAFVVFYRPEAAFNPSMRLSLFEAGANMVAHDVESIIYTMHRAVLLNNHKRKGNIVCPYCGLGGLTEDDLWYHFPAYHINNPSESATLMCPICHQHHDDPLQVHIHECHGPNARRDSGQSHRGGGGRVRVHSYTFSLVVCRHPISKRYLLCQEFGNQGFWLPGGGVDAGEWPSL